MSAPWSLRGRLIVATIASTALVVALAASTAWLASARSLTRSFEEAVREHARSLRPRMETMAWRHEADPAAPPEELPRANSLDDILVELRGADGRVLARSGGSGQLEERLASSRSEVPRDRSLDSSLDRRPGRQRDGPTEVRADERLWHALVPELGHVAWMEVPIVAKPPPGRPPRRGPEVFRPGEPPRPGDQRPPPRERADGGSEGRPAGVDGFRDRPTDPSEPGRNEREPSPPRDERPPPRQDDAAEPGGSAPARMILVRPTARLDGELRRQAWLLAGMWASACLLVAVTALAVTGRVLSPLRRLIIAISGISPGAPGRLAVPGLAAELVPVQARVNDLLMRVDAVLAREQQTTANIAHELRTPLAGMRAKLELAAMRERPREELAATCAQALAIMTHLQALVDNLLLLARLESGRDALHVEAIEVAEVVAVAWSMHQPAADSRGLALDRRIEPALSVTTDVTKLRAILGNLISNAVTYADPGTSIRVSATELATGGARITVANDGATITAADAERVFEPFWRGDKARSVEEGHCGLGLPLVRRLAMVLGGAVAVAVEGRCFTVTVMVPDDGGKPAQRG